MAQGLIRAASATPPDGLAGMLATSGLTGQAWSGLPHGTDLPADRVHGRTTATPERLAARMRQPLLAVPTTALSHGQSTMAEGGRTPLG
ncbi:MULTISPECIES: hypothetical protein [unclassified Streptomyces]|uniref:hypothetical protein n=1 Tax=Streptomyces sp. NPDC055082 TaxID=3365718 RepID=UPI0037D66252